MSRTVLLGCVAVAILTTSALTAEQPAIHAGFSRLPNQIADPGELLVGELNCVACHQTEASVKSRLASRQGPALGPQLPLNPNFVRKLLADPQSVQPGASMPDVFAGMNESEKSSAIDALVHFLASVTAAGNPPVVAAEEVKIQQGRLLYHQVGCVACHSPQEPASLLQAKSAGANGTATVSARAGALDQRSVPLGDLARKTTVDALTRFLKDPLKSRPDGRMPSLNLTDAEASAIAMYLLRDQSSTSAPGGPRPKTKGLSYQYYEGEFNSTLDLEKQKPKSSGLIDRFDVGDRKAKQNFGLRLSGILTLPRDGNYTFYTESDDGSRLFIDGNQVVENDGIHGPTEVKGEAVDLKAGEHSILATFFNGGAGAELKVFYEGPGINKRQIPTSALFTYGGQPMVPTDWENLVVDSEKSARGKQLFGSLGCAACHSVSGVNGLESPKAKSFADLSGSGGCLASNPKSGVPKFALSNEQRAAIGNALQHRTDLVKPLDAAAQVNRTMAAMNCFASHTRGGVGGPAPERAEYFTVVGGVDLGDEGRIPPHLNKVGDKLKPEWLREVLFNKGTARPYMATRMPQFGERNLAQLPAAFEKADSAGSGKFANESETMDAKFGRNLVGTGGFACISCHTFGPHKSLGIPAMDLTLMSKRLKKDWFHRYLLDPPSLRPGTRMPQFWPEGKSSRPDVLSGNTDRQIDAIWAYLARGKEAGLPPGLVQGKMELVASTEPVIYRHFIQGAGSRAIGVGYPEKANLAFDANDMRLALIWQGPFIDMARHRTGRGDGFEGPLGYNTIRMPAGPSFALLENAEAKWPEVAGKKAGFQLHGYTFDKKRNPAFRYSYQGFNIEDAPVTMPGEVDPYFRRTITVTSDQPTDQLWFRAWSGAKIEEQSGGVFIADGKLRLQFKLPTGSKPLIRQSGGHSELLVPVRFEGKTAQIVEEITW